MDSRKVQAVTDWPELTAIEELQLVLGFTNFSRWFICNYSCLANPLTSLLQGKPRQLHWMEQARAAFTHLKESFYHGSNSETAGPQPSFHH